MRTAFFAAATILTLSMATAMAEPAQVRQQMQVASTHADILGSNTIRDRSSTAAGTDATPIQPSDSCPEPESIERGTEP
jgi:hypothetical protein